MGSSLHSLTEEEKTWAWFTGDSTWCESITWKWVAIVIRPISTSLEDSGERKSLWADIWAVHLVIHFAWKEKWLDVRLYVQRRAPVVWWDGHGLEKNMTRNLMIREFEKKVCINLSEWKKKCKDIYVPHECPSNGDFNRGLNGDFNRGVF